MRTYLFLLAILGVVCPAFGQQASTSPPLVTTSGSAEIRVVPDLADLYFEVEIRNVDLAAARKEHAERATKVLAALRRAGITEAELQSSQIQIAAEYAERGRELEKVRFYRVSQNISGTLHDLKKLPDVTADAVTAGATGVRAASLRTSELRKYRDEARAKAIRIAKEKATALATELGAKIGKPHAITEGGVLDWRYTSNSMSNQSSSAGGNEAAEDAQPTFAPGTISITAMVTVSFILE